MHINIYLFINILECIIYERSNSLTKKNLLVIFKEIISKVG
jgi:hypothetical protein